MKTGRNAGEEGRKPELTVIDGAANKRTAPRRYRLRSEVVYQCDTERVRRGLRAILEEEGETR